MIRIACTALLKRIKAGRPNKDGTAFIGGGEDVTSDCLKAIIEFIGAGETHVVQRDGVPVFEISVRAVAADDRPTDCSGDPTSCPDNEGHGCYCSDHATPSTDASGAEVKA